MARYKSLISLLTDLRGEARLSLNPAHNVQSRDTQVQLLQRIQENLWHDFDWPHLRVRRTVPLQSGQRYYDVPDDLDIDRIEKIEVRDGSEWKRLGAGIGANNYAAFDSDLDIRSSPVMRWQLSEDEMIEIWPISDVDADEDTLEGMLRITGIRQLTPLIQDTDLADLDSRLLSLYGAAELLAKKDPKDAKLKLSAADKLYRRLRGGLSIRKRFKMFGTGTYHGSRRPRRMTAIYNRTE